MWVTYTELHILMTPDVRKGNHERHQNRSLSRYLQLPGYVLACHFVSEERTLGMLCGCMSPVMSARGVKVLKPDQEGVGRDKGKKVYMKLPQGSRFFLI